MPAEQGRVGREKRANIDAPSLEHNERNRSLPFVEMAENGAALGGEV